MKLSTTDPYIFLLVMSISFRDFFYLIYGEVRKKYTLEFKKIQMSKSTVAKKKKKKKQQLLGFELSTLELFKNIRFVLYKMPLLIPPPPHLQMQLLI